MFYNLKLKLIEKLINLLKKADIETRYKLGAENKNKILNKLDKVYKNIILWDMFLELLYGEDSQIYIDFKDKLNVLSIDKDREDTTKTNE